MAYCPGCNGSDWAKHNMCPTSVNADVDHQKGVRAKNKKFKTMPRREVSQVSHHKTTYANAKVQLKFASRTGPDSVQNRILKRKRERNKGVRFYKYREKKNARYLKYRMSGERGKITM